MRYLIYVLCATVALAGVPAPTRAAIIGTDTVMAAGARADNLARVTRVLQSAEVRERMQALGVAPDTIDARLAALTDAELASFADRLDQAPAGGDALEVVGLVFLVLLILELVGVIDIFKTIGKARTT
jgi:hypothetical protein